MRAFEDAGWHPYGMLLVVGFRFRWCRSFLAQPPANRCDASGIEKMEELQILAFSQTEKAVANPGALPLAKVKLAFGQRQDDPM